jgi:hypothetical protein
MSRASRIQMVARRLATAGVAAVAMSIAACSDFATAPSAPTARDIDGPSDVVLQVAAKVKVRIVDTANVQLKETGWVEFTSSNADTVYIRDNSAKDLDPAVGVIQVAMAKAASYKACFTMSQHYRGDYVVGTPFPKCATVSTSSMQVDVGKVFARQSPQIVFLMKNQFGTLIGGGEVTVAVPAQNWSVTFADNNLSYDETSQNGIITYSMGYPNSFTWCEASAPAKHKLMTQKCGNFEAKWGSKMTVTFIHEQQIF